MHSILRSYGTAAFRSFRRHRANAILNILGLSIGLASSTLILTYVLFELSYDSYHPNADRIFRIYKQDPGNDFMGTDYFGVVPGPFAPALKEDFPEVEEVVMFRGIGRTLVKVEDQSFSEVSLMWATPSALSVFDFPLISGEAGSALAGPGSVVIAADVAERWFGTADAVGRRLRVADAYDMIVTGVMQNLRPATHIGAPILLSMSTFDQYQQDQMAWDNSSYRSFVLLRKGADVDAIRARLPGFVDRHMTREEGDDGPASRFFFQPLTDIHLRSAHINFEGADLGDTRMIIFLSAIAFVLLATASVNYMNLATARARLRAREIGLRMVIGARRSELVMQFLAESVATALGAGIAGLFIVEALLPTFSALVGRTLPSTLFSQGLLLTLYAALVLLVGLCSGIYPASILSSFTPVENLKGGTYGRQRSKFRDSLVVLQFAASIGLAICAMVILTQLNFIRGTDPGYDRGQILTVRLIDTKARERLTVLRDKVAVIPGVAAFAASTHLPIEVGSSSGISTINAQGVAVDQQSYQLYTDRSFLDVYQIPLLEGRFLPDKVLGEDEATTEYVVNETFARTFGLQNPVGAVVKRGARDVTIIGVVRDFHMHSFRQQIAPLMIGNRNDRWVNHVNIRLRPGTIPATVDAVRGAFAAVVPDQPFDYTFLDESFDRMYTRDARVGVIVSSFTVLALFVASMGLFGLATFVAQERRKEIGIRKVLGASSVSLALRLSREFLVMAALANVIAWPVAYLLMDRWLQDFAYRISLGPAYFLLSGLGAAVVALITVNIQTARAAAANPVESLRYE